MVMRRSTKGKERDTKQLTRQQQWQWGQQREKQTEHSTTAAAEMLEVAGCAVMFCMLRLGCVCLSVACLPGCHQGLQPQLSRSGAQYSAVCALRVLAAVRHREASQ